MVKSFRKSNTTGNYGRMTFLVLICFLFLYSFLLPGLPFGTLLFVVGVISVYTLCLFLSKTVRIDKTRSTKMVRMYCLWNVFLLIYISFLLWAWGSGNGTAPLKDYILMLIILPIFYIFGSNVFKNVEEVMKVLYIGVTIQSIIILAALFIPSLAVRLSLLLPEGAFHSDNMGGFEKAIVYGYHLGLGVFSSAGCVKMAVGQIGICYFLIKSRGMQFFLNLTVYFFVAIATTVIARTGLLISVVGLLAVFVIRKKQSSSRAIGFIIFLTIFLYVGYNILFSFFSMDFLEDTFIRLVRTNEGGINATFFEKYLGEAGDNVIPPLCPETIVGLGITGGTSGSGITSITDGGYLRNYTAMGLIVSFINYLIISSFFFKQYKMSKLYEYKGIILVMSLFFIIGEFKEYYIYYYSPICIAFLVFNLIEREKIYVSPKRAKAIRSKLNVF